MALVMRTLANQTTAGALMGAFDLTNPADTPINTKIKAIELAQPEGTLMELRLVLPVESVNLPLLGSTTLWTGARAATQIANTLNAKYAAGTLADPATGEKLVLWPAPYHYPVAVAQGNVVVLRWVKLQAFAFILVGILVAVLAYVAWKYLHRASWSLAGSTSANGSTTPATPKILGIPWYYVVGGIVAVGVPIGYWYFADIDRNRESLLENQSKIRQLRGGS
jgi:hypothetical protein